MAGYFIAMEGVEGSGKTTQAHRLATRLSHSGWEVVTTHEPGATWLGSEIREILLGSGSEAITPEAETLLYAADRAMHVSSIIRPALGRGAVVISDRYADSTRAYQGAARGLGVEAVGLISSWAAGGLEPDFVVVVDVDAELALGRIEAPLDRIEAESMQFHRDVREAFLRFAHAEPDRYGVVDGALSAAEVEERIWALVEPKITAHFGEA